MLYKSHAFHIWINDDDDSGVWNGMFRLRYNKVRLLKKNYRENKTQPSHTSNKHCGWTRKKNKAKFKYIN